jgi:quercetin dioxygenase-like cupin family protein
MNLKLASLSLIASAVFAFTLLAAGALGTPPAGQIGAVIGRGTTGDTLNYDVPMQVVITKKTRVKRHGKYVIVKKQVTQTIQRPIIACGGASACDVVQQKISYPPGSSSGWHSHPGMVFGVVTAGTVTAYNPDCSKQTFTAGQTFVEMGPTNIRNVKNEGSVQAEVLGTLIVPAGTANPALRIDQPQPASCSA